jgi:NADH-quinone oxidoreductase subunit L
LFETFAALAGLIPLFPLAAFVIIVLFTNPNKRLSSNIAIGAMGLSALLSVLVFLAAFGIGGHLAEEPYYSVPIPWAPTGTTSLNIGWIVDPLSATTVAMVGIVCLMIFIYSQGYMAKDPLYSRFFAYISLFACGMLGFVLSDNLLTAVIFWEIMGLCSYLLIGFWFDRPRHGRRGLGGVYDEYGKLSPSDSGKKAFLTTRIGDVLFLLGIWTVYAQTGSLSLRDILHEGTLERLAQTAVTLIPSSWVLSFGDLGTLTISLPFVLAVPAASLVAFLMFGGAVGKSAQFPLHVWLPDAMAGPTPVSALIHAATMVAAGVYLVARTFPLFAAVEHGHGPALQVVAFIGAFTAFFAASMGLAQNDIKRVLAYSTISQLGYMMTALGIGAFVAGVFHLITHAFFKALLFLGSGSVIHGVEHEMEHTHAHDDPNDMLVMGGLRERMPRTFWTFLIGALALTGIAPFAGFWSKDEILADAWNNGHSVIWLVLTAAAFLTALYMARQVFLVFFGRPRTGAAEHAVESVPSMTWPLMVLAFFATVLGFAGPLGLFHSFVGEAFEPSRFNILVAGTSTLAALAGWGAGWWLYGRKPLAAGQRDPIKGLGPLYTLLNRKYFLDELYLLTLVRVTVVFSTFNALVDQRVVDGLVNLAGILTALFSRLQGWIDNNIVDGIVNLIGTITGELSAGLRLIQTGKVQNYLLVVFFSVLVLAGLSMMTR